MGGGRFHCRLQTCQSWAGELQKGLEELGQGFADMDMDLSKRALA